MQAAARGRASLLIRTAAAAGRSAASALAPRAGQGGLGIDGKTHIGIVNGHVGHLGKQLLVHAEIVSLFLSLGVGVFWLVQSQCESGPASAAAGKEYSDGAGRIAVKVGIQLLFSRIGYRYHADLRRFHIR